MRKGPGSVYDKWSISMVICDRDIKFFFFETTLKGMFLG
jgi:hypothetical protein